MHEIAEHWPAYTNDDHVGRVTISIWSPRLEKNIGYVWLPIEFSGPGTAFEVGTLDGRFSARTAPVPFIDPKKDVPKKEDREELDRDYPPAARGI